ncbi:MAG: hypothetical protein Q9195_002738 [Heterodermia aff. obscurata]
MQLSQDITRANLPLSIKRKQSEETDEDRKLSKRAIKKRRSEKTNPSVGEVGILDNERGINSAIGKMDRQLIADWVAQRIRRFAPDMSVVELEDQYLPGRNGTMSLSTTDFSQTHMIYRAMLQGYYHYSSKRTKSSKLSSASKSLGSPHTLVVTAAGLRAADATRTLRVFQTEDACVAKLFAKHIKLKDALEYVKKTRMAIGVGTPTRLIDLLDAEKDALSSNKLERIIVDCSHINQKKHGIFDMKETLQPLIALLNRENMKSRYGKENEGIDLLLY